MENFANFAASSTLNMPGDLDSSTTVIVPTDTSVFSQAFPFRIRIDNELIKVTGYSVTNVSWTTTRANGGTTAAAHTNGATIKQVLTKEGLDAVVTVQAAGSEVASRRILNFTGGTPTDDSGNDRINIPLGGAAQSAELAWTTPVDANFNWLNQGTATRTVNSDGTIYIKAPAVSGNHGRGYMVAAPATPYTVILKSIGCCLDVDFASWGAGWGDITNSKLQALIFLRTNIQVNRNNFTSFVGSDLSVGAGSVTQFSWIKLNDNGTNLIWSVSVDGRNWIQIYSTARTGFLTPSYVGLYTESNNGTWDAGQLLVSWSQ